ncbi:MAG: bifunctional 4-hydroxy-3-methylbut-2-enyl diphosphate reductase/30S ribosomal protein S1 [Bacillota bacterium]
MPVIVAKHAGFCTGVKKAVNTLLNRSEEVGAGVTLGPIVHNEEVIKYLSNQQIGVINDIGEVYGSFIAIRTHGVKPDVYEQLKCFEDKEIIDLTCQRVKKVQDIVAKSKENDYQIIIYGDPEHPEVQGLLGWSGENAFVISSPDDLNSLPDNKQSILVSQTTGKAETFAIISKAFADKYPEGIICDTLCPEAHSRHKEVFGLANRVDVFVVVGSKTSANTKSLYNCCRQLKPSCLVTNAEELDFAFLRQHRNIGVTAGASTPPWTIKEVVERMKNENLEVKNEEPESEETETQKDEKETEEVVQVQSNDQDTQSEGMEEALKEEQFNFGGDVKVAQVGEQVTGKIARVTDEEVYVDIGSKTEAILPVKEVHLEEEQTLTDLFAPEDDIEVTVLDVDEQDGTVTVSHKRLARDKRLKELEEALEDETILEGKVKQTVPAGIVIDLGRGIEGFMPGSLVDTRYIPDFKEFKDQVINFKVLEYDREKGKLILNRRKILEEETSKKKEETLKDLEVGSTITGTVKRLTDFGAFVDVGGIDGLVHISELSWERVNHPKDVLQVGDQIDVKVLEVLPEKERISLSIRKTQPDPWTKAIKDLETDQILIGKVTRLVNFGAFVEIKPGVEGLAHISQLADYHVKHPSEILNEGEEVEVKVLEVKPKAKRISLSIKDAGGVNVEQQSTGEENAEDGNVTLGDVFGDLFDKESFKENADAETNADYESDSEGGQA